MKKAMIITGPPASGKTTLSKNIAQLFNSREVVFTSLFNMLHISEGLMSADNITKLIVIDECPSAVAIQELHASPQMKRYVEKGGAVIYVSLYGSELTNDDNFFHCSSI